MNDNDLAQIIKSLCRFSIVSKDDKFALVSIDTPHGSRFLAKIKLEGIGPVIKKEPKKENKQETRPKPIVKRIVDDEEIKLPFNHELQRRRAEDDRKD